MSKLRKTILDGNFNEAYEIVRKMERKQICEDLISISFDTQNMLAYGFVMYVLSKEETVEWHSIASSLLINSYIVMEGAGQLAYIHAKKALELDSSSYLALSDMMFLARHPDTNGTEEDFEYAKKKIVDLYPDSDILTMQYYS